ncbi:exosortase system-associated protein, TIGR04073 family [Geobacter grbiciae]|uniref:exosortase system-associated protein, TIGR04073 family n=1 Tax=Geobacter grbiciae TaxID=155042 RepID=UPI001C028878|nr:exosortase system-associated protein, TIGR04073 family [Geobacter grbiciae]MBT1074771.1 exosortase system-associated protein, TIGR04073 family [Geobacter grbiciae]
MKPGRLITGAALACLLVCGQHQRVHAESITSVEDASAQEVVDGMANKFARGVANTATGWLEFPKQIYVTWQEEGPAKGLIVGPLKGVGMTVARTLAGAGEAVTFFISWPGFFDAYMDPAYVWEKE